MWSQWSMWGACSSSCGGGLQRRERDCVNGVVGDAGCIGAMMQNVTCNLQVRSYDNFYIFLLFQGTAQINFSNQVGLNRIFNLENSQAFESL